MPTAPTPAAALCTLADQIEADLGEQFDGPHSLVRVRECGEVGLHPLAAGEHPVDSLLGFVAPADWTVFGTVTFGWAAPIDGVRPSKHPKRSTSAQCS